MFKDFKEFALSGSLVDMATGIIIGAAFGTVITSLVSDIIMPPIGLLLGGIDFTNLFQVIKGDGEFTTLAAAQAAGAVTINWGNFINHIISFLVVAFCIFMLIRVMNKARKAQQEQAEEAPRSEVLLEEIRDLLKGR